MPISSSQTTELIWTFLKTLGVPKNCYVLDRGINRRTNKRRVDVQISVWRNNMQTPEEYLVLKVLVSESGHITILSDRREYIRELLSRPGVSVVRRTRRYNEKKAREVFFDSITSTNSIPEWVLSIDRGAEDDILNGTDAWVSFVNIHGKGCRGPIKVCVNQKDKAAFFGRKTPREIEKIVSVIVTPGKEKSDIVRDFFRLLENKRNNGSY